ncbi:hypothetical protein FS837_005694 [Tulasnella sp. UAMH 9824]|nr:hypothetical protein FS837_005694 [Tulasnella sp. UAMH 9824]
MSHNIVPPLDENTIELLYGSRNARQHPAPQVIALDKRKRVPILTGVVPTILVVLFSAGLAIFLIIWLRVHQPQGIPGYETGFFAAFRKGTFIVDEGYHEDGEVVQASLRALTFSSVASHMVGLTSSFLMTLVAYRTASQWLETSRQPSEGVQDKNPTPVQYGLLLGLLGASNAMSVYNAIRYALRSKTRRSKLPSIFTEPLIIATMVLILNHALGASDLWLHTTARSAVMAVAVEGGVQDPSALQLGVAFNESLCEPLANGYISYPCLQGSHGWALGQRYEWLMPNSWLVINNSTSAPVRIITLADQNHTAVMVPTAVHSLSSRTSTSYAFTASTLAVRSNCNIITAACFQDDREGVTDCTPAGAPYLPLKWNFTGETPPACNVTICFPEKVFAVHEGRTGVWRHGGPQIFPTNWILPPGPVTIGLQLGVGVPGVEIYTSPSSKWAMDNRARLYGICQVEYLNGILSFDPLANVYKLVNEAHTHPNRTASLLGPLISQYGTFRFSSDITGLVTGDAAVDPTLVINAHLSRIALGLLGGAVQLVGPNQASLVRQGVFGLYPVAPVMCVSGILYLYALFAMYIFFSSVSSKSYIITTTASPKEENGVEERSSSTTSSKAPKEKTALVLGQLWLTDPLPLIASVFSREDGTDPERTIADDSLDMVYDVNGRAGRLEIGLRTVGEEARFGLERKEDSESSEIV